MKQTTNTDAAKAVGRRVTVRRESAGMNKSQLATYAGVSRAYITRLEAGHYPRSSATHIQQVARALNCTVQDLLGDAIEGASDALNVPHGEAPAIRRLLALDLGPEQLWDVVEGIVRMFSRSGDEPHQHVLGGHAETENQREGQQQA